MSKVRPLRPIIPKEFSPKNKITNKRFQFVQPVPRVNTYAQKKTNNEANEKTAEEKREENEENKKENYENENKRESGNENKNQEEEEKDENNQKTRDINHDDNDHNSRKSNDNDDDDNHKHNEEENNDPSSKGRSSKQKNTKKKSEKKKQKSLLDDEEMQSLRQELSETHDFSEIENEKLEVFVHYIKQYSKKNASEGNYDEAKKSKVLYDEAINALYHKRIDTTKSEEARKTYEKMKTEKEEKYVAF